MFDPTTTDVHYLAGAGAGEARDGVGGTNNFPATASSALLGYPEGIVVVGEAGADTGLYISVSEGAGGGGWARIVWLSWSGGDQGSGVHGLGCVHSCGGRWVTSTSST